MSKKSKAPVRGTVAYAMIDFFPKLLVAPEPTTVEDHPDGKSSLRTKKERCVKEGCKHAADLDCFEKYACLLVSYAD